MTLADADEVTNEPSRKAEEPRRERTLDALRHIQPDSVPYDIRFTSGARAKMAGHYGDPDFESKLGNCLTIVRLNTHKEVAPDIWQDHFGARWNRSVDRDIGVVENVQITPENIDDYSFPDPDDPALYEGYRDRVSLRADTLAVVKLSYSLFERAWSLVGMENLLLHMIADKAFVNRLLDRILEYNVRVIENACVSDIDAVYFGDDWGQQTGLIMGPELWRELIRPRIREMYARVKSKGKLVFIHCCGQVAEIFPDLIECGVDVFNPLQPEVMDVYEMKERFGGDVSFYGGISTQRLLPFGTVEQVRDEVRRLLDKLGDGGGYIASPAHAIPPDARPENVAAMIEALQDQ